MKRTILGFTPLALVVSSLLLGCGGDSSASSAAGSETAGDGDGDPGDGDGAPGDGDGDGTGDGDGDGAPGPDGDMDGVPDSADNCPDIPNPNQRDFDGNGEGNVCDTQVFSTVNGSLTTTVAVTSEIGDCMVSVQLLLAGGQVSVQLDDDAAVAKFEVEILHLADALDKPCNSAFSVSLREFTISNSGGDFPVMMPHSIVMHDGGQVAGMSDTVHPVLTTMNLEATLMGMAPTQAPLMFDGALPVFTANITAAGDEGSLSWAEPDLVLGTDSFDLDTGLIGVIPVNVSLVGLTGAVFVAP